MRINIINLKEVNENENNRYDSRSWGDSTRFNNKPLADICGKPMVYWVWKHSKEVSCFDEVYVATDSEEIKNVAEGFGAKVIMTSSNCETATERLYEVSKKFRQICM